MSAVLFGSISSLADTSELQRDAFNQAFAEAGLDWHWDRDDYAEMLQGSGGRDRVEAYARDRGDEVDATAIHERKSEIFRQALAQGHASPRAGVVDTITAAKRHGWKIGLVTTTSPANVAALLDALSTEIDRDDFAIITDTDSVSTVKPDPAVYSYVLDELHEQAADCVAIEDNLGGVASARSAGLACIAFPNANTESHDFSDASVRVATLEADDVLGRVGQA